MGGNLPGGAGNAVLSTEGHLAQCGGGPHEVSSQVGRGVYMMT